jgi:hypothetical protein
VAHAANHAVFQVSKQPKPDFTKGEELMEDFSAKKLSLSWKLMQRFCFTKLICEPRVMSLTTNFV